VLILTVTTGVGIIKGLIHTFNYYSEWQNFTQALTDLETGQMPNIKQTGKDSKIKKQLVLSLKKIHKQLQEQTKRSQDLISQRVEDQEEAIEKRITAERNRLARELHDSVSQELFAASMLVSAINEMPETQQTQIQTPIRQVEQMIQQAQLEMRALLLHLRPVALKDNSLKDGIDALLKDLVAKVPLTINWQIEAVQLPKGIEDHLFRILQESVSNTLRHAKADTLDISLIEREEKVILTVVDDGIGFEVTDEPFSSYGLSNMNERTAEIGGTLRIVSIPGEGTKLDCFVPIIKEEVKNNDHSIISR
jgi:NarL family two-component system sensor histidine kinase LiaS